MFDLLGKVGTLADANLEQQNATMFLVQSESLRDVNHLGA